MLSSTAARRREQILADVEPGGAALAPRLGESVLDQHAGVHQRADSLFRSPGRVARLTSDDAAREHEMARPVAAIKISVNGEVQLRSWHSQPARAPATGSCSPTLSTADCGT